MTWSEAPLFVEVQDLARWVAERAAAWVDRGHAILAARVAGEACSMLESVALALTFPATRPGDLEQADRSLARLRVLLRLARDLGLLPASGLRFAAGRLQAAGRMIGGWRKRLERDADLHALALPVDEDSGDGPQRRQACDAGWQLLE